LLQVNTFFGAEGQSGSTQYPESSSSMTTTHQEKSKVIGQNTFDTPKK
jgi:hypothetical protein